MDQHPVASVTSKPKSSKKKWLFILLFVLLFFAAGAAAAYAYFVAPQQALLKYRDNVAAASSGTYELAVALSDGEDNYSAKAQGRYDWREGGNPLFSAGIRAELFEDDTDLALNLIYAEGDLYLQPLRLSLLELFLLELDIDREAWYLLPASEDDFGELGESMVTSYTSCSAEDIAALKELDFAAVVALKGAERASPFRTEIDGASVRHYRGEFDLEATVANLQAAFEAALSGECRDEFGDFGSQDWGVDREQLRAQIIEPSYTYDVWLGKGIDRLRLNVTGDEGQALSLSLTTTNYNRDVNLSAPSENVINFQELMTTIMGDLFGADMEFDFGGVNHNQEFEDTADEADDSAEETLEGGGGSLPAPDNSGSESLFQ